MSAVRLRAPSFLHFILWKRSFTRKYNWLTYCVLKKSGGGIFYKFLCKFAAYLWCVRVKISPDIIFDTGLLLILHGGSAHRPVYVWGCPRYCGVLSLFPF